MKYPLLEEVEEATQLQLARWIRFLPSPGLSAASGHNFDRVFEEEKEILDLITKRFNGWTPMLSKAVGWK